MGVSFLDWLQGVKNLAGLPCGLSFILFLHEDPRRRHEVPRRIINKLNMEFDSLSRQIIGCAIEVHKMLGPGLLESAYEECLVYELNGLGIQVARQRPVPVVYKEIKLDCGYRLDLIVENKIIVELKSVDALAPVHEAQILTYMKFSKIRTGLLINFNVTAIKHGIRRYVL